jgi:hypothetical protein
LRLEDKSSYAFRDESRVEVDEQGYFLARHSEVREHLGFEDRIKPLHALDLYNHSILDQQVQPIFANRPTFVNNWINDLSLEAEAHVPEFDAQRPFVSCFEQPRPELAIHLNSTPDHFFGQPIDFLHRPHRQTALLGVFESFFPSVPLCLRGG